MMSATSVRSAALQRLLELTKASNRQLEDLPEASDSEPSDVERKGGPASDPEDNGLNSADQAHVRRMLTAFRGHAGLDASLENTTLQAAAGGMGASGRSLGGVADLGTAKGVDIKLLLETIDRIFVQHRIPVSQVGTHVLATKQKSQKNLFDDDSKAQENEEKQLRRALSILRQGPSADDDLPMQPARSVEDADVLLKAFGNLTFLQSLSKEQKQLVFQFARLKEVPKGAYLVAEGDYQDNVLIILSGSAVVESPIFAIKDSKSAMRDALSLETADDDPVDEVELERMAAEKTANERPELAIESSDDDVEAQEYNQDSDSPADSDNEVDEPARPAPLPSGAKVSSPQQRRRRKLTRKRSKRKGTRRKIAKGRKRLSPIRGKAGRKTKSAPQAQSQDHDSPINVADSPPAAVVVDVQSSPSGTIDPTRPLAVPNRVMSERVTSPSMSKPDLKLTDDQNQGAHRVESTAFDKSKRMPTISTVQMHDGNEVFVELHTHQKRKVCLVREGDVIGERSVLELMPTLVNVECTIPTMCLAIDMWTYHRVIRGVSVWPFASLRAQMLNAQLPMPPPLAYCSEEMTMNTTTSKWHSTFTRLFCCRRPPPEDELFESAARDFGALPVADQQSKWEERRDLIRSMVCPVWAQKDINMPHRLYKAARFINDATNLEDERSHYTDARRMAYDRFFGSTFFAGIMFITMVGNLWIAQYEAPSFSEMTSPRFADRFPYLITTEWIMLAIYLSEMAFKVIDLGIVRFFDDANRTFYMLVLLVILVDLSVTTVIVNPDVGIAIDWFRISRPLRPLLLMRFRPMRQMVYTIGFILPRLTEMLLLLTAVLFFSAFAGHNLFKTRANVYIESAYNAGQPPFSSCSSLGTPQCADVESFIFSSFKNVFPDSFTTMFVTMTTSNLPDLWWPPYASSAQNIWFFEVFVLVTSIFLLNVFLATVYQGYRDGTLKSIHYERRKERRALKRSFMVMDVRDCGMMCYDTFELLVQHIRPSYVPYQIRTVFTLLDGNEEGVLQLEDFNGILDALALDITAKASTRDMSQEHHMDLLFANPRNESQLFNVYATTLQDLLRRVPYHVIYYTITLADGIFYIWYAAEDDKMAHWLDLGCAVYFAADILLHLAAYQRHFYDVPWKMFDTAITVGQFVGIVSDQDSNVRGRGVSALGVLRICALARTIRLAVLVHAVEHFWHPERRRQVSSLTSTIRRLVPLFVALVFGAFVLLLYPFSLIGMEMFNGQGDGADRCNTVLFMNDNVEARFCELSKAIDTLFQIMIGANWHSIMYGAQANHSKWVFVYFIVFYVLGVLVTVNVFLAVFLDSFEQERKINTRGTSVLEARARLMHHAAGDETARFSRLPKDKRNRAINMIGGSISSLFQKVVVRQKSSVQDVQRRLRMAYEQ